MIAATGHDRHVVADYERLRSVGIATAREGLRWHLIEPSPGRLDFSSVLPMLRAARGAGIQVIWDLLHYGWPDDVDIFEPRFVDRFARFVTAFVRLHANEADEPLWIAPVNEISYTAWTVGDLALFHPFAAGRADELKQQLVRAAIAATEATWAVDPQARIAQIDPVFHVVPRSERYDDGEATEQFRHCQFEAWDMLAGRRHPHLGGHPKYLDVIGVNYYAANQWVFDPDRGCENQALATDDPRYRPFREILAEIHRRYGRPLFVAETGAEGNARAPWLRYVGQEVEAAWLAGVPVEGVCLYPIVSFPGWLDDRDCCNGLWEAADEWGRRDAHRPLAAELRRQVARLEALRDTAPGTSARPAATLAR
jgi:beta-glucosidase/6-phospho-beta-glucosidase/beta-galactosidase